MMIKTCKALIYSFTQLMHILCIKLLDSSLNVSDMHLGFEILGVYKITLVILAKLVRYQTEK